MQEKEGREGKGRRNGEREEGSQAVVTQNKYLVKFIDIFLNNLQTYWSRYTKFPNPTPQFMVCTTDTDSDSSTQ